LNVFFDANVVISNFEAWHSKLLFYKSRGWTFFLVDIALLEIIARKRAQFSDAEAKYTTARIAFQKTVSKSGIDFKLNELPLNLADQACDSYRTSLLKFFELVDSDIVLGESIQREIRGEFPCEDKKSIKTGARDSAIWLSMNHYISEKKINSCTFVSNDGCFYPRSNEEFRQRKMESDKNGSNVQIVKPTSFALSWSYEEFEPYYEANIASILNSGGGETNPRTMLSYYLMGHPTVSEGQRNFERSIQNTSNHPPYFVIENERELTNNDLDGIFRDRLGEQYNAAKSNGVRPRIFLKLSGYFDLSDVTVNPFHRIRTHVEVDFVFVPNLDFYQHDLDLLSVIVGSIEDLGPW
jgi:PIN domain